jgi:DnaJ homolog subfamily C member 3
MQARIHLKEGAYSEAREALTSYATARSSGDMKKTIDELEKEINDAEKMTQRAEKERKSELWAACVESSTEALRNSAWNIKMRETRVECQLRSGDIEGAVGDLTYVVPIGPFILLLTNFIAVFHPFSQKHEHHLYTAKSSSCHISSYHLPHHLQHTCNH